MVRSVIAKPACSLRCAFVCLMQDVLIYYWKVRLWPATILGFALLVEPLATCSCRVKDSLILLAVH